MGETIHIVIKIVLT